MVAGHQHGTIHPTQSLIHSTSLFLFTTGKASYEFGDIEAAVARIGEMNKSASEKSFNFFNKFRLDLFTDGELKAWDRQFLERTNRDGAEAALEAWDRKFLEENLAKPGSNLIM